MKLEKEFESADLLISRQKRVLSQIKISEKFAIEFVRWLENLSYEFYETTIAETYEELLEIYKKTL